MSYASRHSTPERSASEQEETEEEEVEHALELELEPEPSEQSEDASVLEEQILQQLHSNLLDPLVFPRTALSQITERSERTRSLATSSERYSQYVPSRPPSFLQSSSAGSEESSPAVAPHRASRLDEDFSPIDLPERHSRVWSDDGSLPSSDSSSFPDVPPVAPLSDSERPPRPPRRTTNVSPVRRLAQFYEQKSSESSSSSSPSSTSSYGRSRTMTPSAKSIFSSSRSMPSISTAVPQPSSYSRSTTMPSIASSSDPCSPSVTTSSRSLSPVKPFVSSQTSRPVSPTKGSYTTSSASMTSSTTKPRSISSLRSSGSSESFSLTSTPSATQSAASLLTPSQSSKSRTAFSSIRSALSSLRERPSSSSRISSTISHFESLSPMREGLFSIRRRPASTRRSTSGSEMPPSYSESTVTASTEVESTSGQSTITFRPEKTGDEESTVRGVDEQSEHSSAAASFDPQTEVGSFVTGTQEPLRIGHLWYLNVHAPPPYVWIRARAILYPTQLILSWIASGGGRGVVTLDLVNCTEVRSVPSPSHPSARGDIGSVAARLQSDVGGPGATSESGEPLVEFLCPFQLIYADGVERLGAESARERVRWVGAIWDALSRATVAADSVRSSSPSPSIPSVTRSPSVRSVPSIVSESSTTSSQSSNGSRSTIFMPPGSAPSVRSPSVSSASFSGDTISSGSQTRPDRVSPAPTPLTAVPTSYLSPTATGTGTITSFLSPDVGTATTFFSPGTRASDDAVLSPPSRFPLSLADVGVRVIPPSRSSTLRRTTSMADLDSEYDSMSSFDRSDNVLSIGLVTGQPVGASTGASVGRGSSLTFTPPPGPRRVARMRGTRLLSDVEDSLSSTRLSETSRSALSASSHSSESESYASASASFTRSPSASYTQSPSASLLSPSASTFTPSASRLSPSTGYTHSPSSASSSFQSSEATPFSSSFVSRSVVSQTASQTSRTPTQVESTITPSVRSGTSYLEPESSVTETPRSFTATSPRSQDRSESSFRASSYGRTQSPSTFGDTEWTSGSSPSRSATDFSSLREPRDSSRGTYLDLPSESESSSLLTPTVDLRRVPAQRRLVRPRTISSEGRAGLEPVTPPRRRTSSDVSGDFNTASEMMTTPTRSSYRSESASDDAIDDLYDDGELTPKTSRTFQSGSVTQERTVSAAGFTYDRSESGSSFTPSYTRSDVESGEDFTASYHESESETALYRRRSATEYSTESQGPPASPPSSSSSSMPSSVSLPRSSDDEYVTASVCTTFVTAEKCPSEESASSYETGTTCPIHAGDGYSTASECESGVTAQCRCKQRTPEPLSSRASLSSPEFISSPVTLDLSTPEVPPSPEVVSWSDGSPSPAMEASTEMEDVSEASPSMESDESSVEPMESEDGLSAIPESPSEESEESELSQLTPEPAVVPLPPFTPSPESSPVSSLLDAPTPELPSSAGPSPIPPSPSSPSTESLPTPEAEPVIELALSVSESEPESEVTPEPTPEPEPEPELEPEIAPSPIVEPEVPVGPAPPQPTPEMLEVATPRASSPSVSSVTVSSETFPSASPSTVPASIELPDVPAHSDASLPSPSLPTSGPSESTPSLSATELSSRDSMEFPDAPPPSISRPPSVVPTIPSITPSSTLSSIQLSAPKAPSVSLWGDSRSPSMEVPSEFGEMPAPGPSPSISLDRDIVTPSLPAESISEAPHRPSVSFDIESDIGELAAVESIPDEFLPDESPSSATLSFESSAPSLHIHLPAKSPSSVTSASALSVPPSPVVPVSPSISSSASSSSYTITSSSESEESSVTLSVGDVSSTIPSLTVPPPPPGSLHRYPSIRTISSVWDRETDHSYESSILERSPSIATIALPDAERYSRTLSYDTSPLRPTSSSFVSSTLSTPSIIADVPPPRSPSVSSEASEASSTTVTHKDVHVAWSEDVSVWEDSSVTEEAQTEFSERRTRSVSSATSSRLSPFVGLPSARSPSLRSRTPSIASLRTVSSRGTARPSIASRVSTIVTESVVDEEIEPPAPILTHDVNRLLSYLHDINQRRADESRDLALHIGRIEEELFDLSGFLRDEAEERWRKEMEEARSKTASVASAPPSSYSVSSSSVSESESSSTISTPSTPERRTITPPAELKAIPTEHPPESPIEPHAELPVSVTPPPIRAKSPSMFTTTETFMSSHYSEYDDLSSVAEEDEGEETELEPETIEISPSAPSATSLPVSSPSSPSSPSSTSSKSPSSSESTASISTPSSPTTSSSSITIQAPRPPITLGALKDALSRLEDQHAKILDGQNNMADALDDLRRRPVFVMPEEESDHGIPDGLKHIELLLEEVLAACRRVKSARSSVISRSEKTLSTVRTESEVETIDSELEEVMLREHWKNLLRRHGVAEPITMPVPPRMPIPSVVVPDVIPEEVVELADVSERPSTPVTLPAIPLFQPRPHRPRARSQSPTLTYSAPPPSAEDGMFADEGVPRFEGLRARQERVQGRPSPRPLSAHGLRRVASQLGLPLEQDIGDMDFERLVRELRQKRKPGSDGFFIPSGPERPVEDIPPRVPTAPPRVDLRPPHRHEQLQQAPLPGETIVPPGTRITVLPPPVQAPPTIVTTPMPQLPQPQPEVPDVREMLHLLRQNDMAQRVALDQQREVIRYLGDLNGWLERDSRDRQTDMGVMAARLDDLHRDLASRLGLGQPAHQPPGVSAPPVQPSIQPFIPSQAGMPPITVVPQSPVQTFYPTRPSEGPRPFIPTLSIQRPPDFPPVSQGPVVFPPQQLGDRPGFIPQMMQQPSGVIGQPPFIPPGSFTVHPPFIPPTDGEPTPIIVPPGQMPTGTVSMYPSGPIQMMPTGAIPIVPTGPPSQVIEGPMYLPGPGTGQQAPFIPGPGGPLHLVEQQGIPFIPQHTAGVPPPFIPPTYIGGQPTGLGPDQGVTVIPPIQPVPTGQVTVIQAPAPPPQTITVVPPTPTGEGTVVTEQPPAPPIAEPQAPLHVDVDVQPQAPVQAPVPSQPERPAVDVDIHVPPQPEHATPITFSQQPSPTIVRIQTPRAPPAVMRVSSRGASRDREPTPHQTIIHIHGAPTPPYVQHTGTYPLPVPTAQPGYPVPPGEQVVIQQPYPVPHGEQVVVHPPPVSGTTVVGQRPSSPSSSSSSSSSEVHAPPPGPIIVQDSGMPQLPFGQQPTGIPPIPTGFPGGPQQPTTVVVSPSPQQPGAPQVFVHPPDVHLAPQPTGPLGYQPTGPTGVPTTITGPPQTVVLEPGVEYPQVPGQTYFPGTPQIIGGPEFGQPPVLVPEPTGVHILPPGVQPPFGVQPTGQLPQVIEVPGQPQPSIQIIPTPGQPIVPGTQLPFAQQPGTILTQVPTGVPPVVAPGPQIIQAPAQVVPAPPQVIPAPPTIVQGQPQIVVSPPPTEYVVPQSPQPILVSGPGLQPGVTPQPLATGGPGGQPFQPLVPGQTVLIPTGQPGQPFYLHTGAVPGVVQIPQPTGVGVPGQPQYVLATPQGVPQVVTGGMPQIVTGIPGPGGVHQIMTGTPGSIPHMVTGLPGGFQPMVVAPTGEGMPQYFTTGPHLVPVPTGTGPHVVSGEPTGIPQHFTGAPTVIPHTTGAHTVVIPQVPDVTSPRPVTAATDRPPIQYVTPASGHYVHTPGYPSGVSYDVQHGGEPGQGRAPSPLPQTIIHLPQPSSPRIIRITSPPRQAPETAVVPIPPAPTTPTVQPAPTTTIRIETPAPAAEAPPTVIRIAQEVAPQQPTPAPQAEPVSTVIRVATTPAPQPVPTPVPQIVRIVGEPRRTPTPTPAAPTVIQVEGGQVPTVAPSIIRVGTSHEQRPAEPPTTIRVEVPPGPEVPMVAPSIVRIGGITPAPPPPPPPAPEPIQQVIATPPPTTVHVEIPPVPVMPEPVPSVIRIASVQPAPVLPAPTPTVVRIDASALQQQPPPQVIVEAQPAPHITIATPPPTIIRLPERPSPVQEGPSIVRVGTSHTVRPSSPTIVQLPPAVAPTPAIVRIHGLQPTPQPQFIPPSVIRVTSPTTLRTTPIVVARAPRDTTFISPPPAQVTQPITAQMPPHVEQIPPQETGRPPLTDIIDGPESYVVEGSSDEIRPPQTEISAPSSTHDLPLPPTRTPTVVVAPRPMSTASASAASLQRLQEMAQWQEEQRQIQAQQAEDRRREMLERVEEHERHRQAVFDEHENERQRAFEEAEEERQRAAEARREELFRTAEERRRLLAETTEQARLEVEAAVQDGISASTQAIEEVLVQAEKDRETIISRLTEVQDKAAADKLEAEERIGQLEVSLQEEHDRLLDEQRERIRALEEELERQRQACEEEKRHFRDVETERWENRHALDEARDGAIRTQLDDITNVLHDRDMETTDWRERQEQRYAEKAQRRVEKAERIQSLHDLVTNIIAEREEEKQRQEQERIAAAAKPGIETILEAINRQAAEQTYMMRTMMDDMRADCQRRHEETLEAVRATAREQVPFNVQQYLDDFSKALSSEVRLLLKEVGKLREEKRALQHEIGCLLCMKAKYGPGGEFDPDWVPPTGSADCAHAHAGAPQASHPVEITPDVVDLDPHILPAEETPMVKPAWKNIQKKKMTTKRQEARDTVHINDDGDPMVSLAAPHPASWASWKPTMQAPTPIQDPPPTLAVERTPGLFGPRSPRNSFVG
ncbi:hypothetical protein FRB99_000899 [Tulasnella sp. 403]|nr:hypothetical protein FRB99_000899 [Tulasnella sp. 403]